MTAEELARRLDRELKPEAFRDDSHNGLQVANSGRPVRKVAVGVDASAAFFDAAAEAGADFLICHHGVSWGESLARLTGMTWRRVRLLFERDMALYASHLPLDAHPRLGNNAQIARALGLRRLRPFGLYHGNRIGVMGETATAVSYERFLRQVEHRFGGPVQSMAFGPKRIQRVAVVSGGGADLLAEAAEAGADLFLSGEPRLSAWHTAKELGLHAVFAGHYATETFGVKALAQWVTRQTGLPTLFIPEAIPY